MTIDHNSHHFMSQNTKRMLIMRNIININKPNNNNNKNIIINNKIITTTTTTNKANSDNVHYQQTLHKEEDKQLIYKEILLIRIKINNMVIV